MSKLQSKRVPLVSLRLVRESTIAYAAALTGPEAAADVARQLIEDSDREKFVVIYLDRKNRVIGAEVVAVGTAAYVVVSPAMVFRGALVAGAAAILVAHNHPSGDPSPSPEDYALTQTLVECGRTLGVGVLDHVVVGDQSYVSVREKYPSLGWE